MSTNLLVYFTPLEDPRIDRNKLHALPDILFLVVSAVRSGAKDWEAMEDSVTPNWIGYVALYHWPMAFLHMTALSM